MLVKRKKIDLPTIADLENAVAGCEKNAIDIEDVASAVIELGELIAEQEDENDG